VSGLEAWHALLEKAVLAEVPAAAGLRRRLHADPRLSGQEEDTAAAVVAALGAGDGHPTAGTGRVVRVLGGAGPTVALRAELDGLAVAEATGVPWAARGMVMHACGHDVHLAALVAVCRAVRDVGGPVPVLAVLQPREEGEPSGGRDVARSGVLEDEDVGASVAVHVQPQLPAGVVAATHGPVNAAVDEVTVTVRGRGGHAAYPHTTHDPVQALAAVVTALHTQVISRVDPVVGAVLAITQIEAGAAFNVVPDTAWARGGLRTMRREDRTGLHAVIEEVVRHTAAAHGCSAIVDIKVSDPVLRNDPELARAATPWLQRAGLEVDDTFRSFGSDDFAHFCAVRPGLMLFLGVDGGAPDAAGKRPGLHSPRFLPGDDTVRQAALALLGGYLGAAGMLGQVAEPRV
jgi:amidohydrolase